VETPNPEEKCCRRKRLLADHERQRRRKKQFKFGLCMWRGGKDPAWNKKAGLEKKGPSLTKKGTDASKTADRRDLCLEKDGNW